MPAGRRKHSTWRVSFRLEDFYRDRAVRACQRAGLSFAGLVRQAIDNALAGRPPEAQALDNWWHRFYAERDYPLLVRAQEILAREAEARRSTVGRAPDPEERARRRASATEAFEAAGLVDELVEEWRQRQHVVESGMRPERHRHRSASAASSGAGRSSPSSSAESAPANDD